MVVYFVWIPDSLIRVLELIQPSHSLMRVAAFIFRKRLVLIMHGVHGRCCSLAVWDGKCRRKTTRVMEGDGAALMGCWGDDNGKSEKEGGLWRKPRKEDKKKGLKKKGLIVGGECWSPTVVLDFENCSGRGVQSIAGDWGCTRDEFLFSGFVLKMEG
jgi:hypothetical protein